MSEQMNELKLSPAMIQRLESEAKDLILHIRSIEARIMSHVEKRDQYLNPNNSSEPYTPNFTVMEDKPTNGYEDEFEGDDFDSHTEDEFGVEDIENEHYDEAIMKLCEQRKLVVAQWSKVAEFIPVESDFWDSADVIEIINIAKKAFPGKGEGAN